MKININKVSFDYDPNNVWHVTPNNDIGMHVEDLQDQGICDCNPRFEIQENKGLLVIHNAFDHRELFEGDRKKIIQ